jgi:hypothetical protein
MKSEPTYISYVIRIPQQDNVLYNNKFQNDYLDHWYNETDLISPWIFKAKFYLTKQTANEDLKGLKIKEPTIMAEVKEVRLKTV